MDENIFTYQKCYLICKNLAKIFRTEDDLLSLLLVRTNAKSIKYKNCLEFKGG